ncbi:MAG: hypothetical protein JWR80_8004 [Bradyrhizobium sp.]|nr:hypothetical protein [Bradyrhizobium sp.]
MIDWEMAAAFTRTTTAAVFDTTLCRMKPMAMPLGGRDVNGKPVADSGRVEFEFLGMLDLEPSQDSIPRHMSPDPGVDGKMVAYDACITAMTDQWLYLPKRGDRIEVPNALPGAVLEIKLDRRDGSPRMAFFLNRVK